MEHFRHFPKINYSDSLVTNVMVRAKVRDIILNNADAYYPYTVRDGQRPDYIARKYYGSDAYTWLVFYSNDMFDPIFDWVMNPREFNDYMRKKYGNLEDTQVIADSTHVLTLGAGTGIYGIGEQVYQGTSLATATAKGIVTAWDASKQKLRVKNVFGRFTQLNGIVVGNTSGTTRQLVFTKETAHHYELSPGGIVIDSLSYYDPSVGGPDKKIVSIYEWEQQENEKRRTIKLIEDIYQERIALELKKMFAKL